MVRALKLVRDCSLLCQLVRMEKSRKGIFARARFSTYSFLPSSVELSLLFKHGWWIDLRQNSLVFSWCKAQVTYSIMLCLLQCQFPLLDFFSMHGTTVSTQQQHRHQALLLIVLWEEKTRLMVVLKVQSHPTRRRMVRRRITTAHTPTGSSM